MCLVWAELLQDLVLDVSKMPQVLFILAIEWLVISYLANLPSKTTKSGSVSSSPLTSQGKGA